MDLFLVNCSKNRLTWTSDSVGSSLPDAAASLAKSFFRFSISCWSLLLSFSRSFLDLTSSSSSCYFAGVVTTQSNSSYSVDIILNIGAIFEERSFFAAVNF